MPNMAYFRVTYSEPLHMPAKLPKCPEECSGMIENDQMPGIQADLDQNTLLLWGNGWPPLGSFLWEDKASEFELFLTEEIHIGSPSMHIL